MGGGGSASNHDWPLAPAVVGRTGSRRRALDAHRTMNETMKSHELLESAEHAHPVVRRQRWRDVGALLTCLEKLVRRNSHEAIYRDQAAGTAMSASPHSRSRCHSNRDTRRGI